MPKKKVNNMSRHTDAIVLSRSNCGLFFGKAKVEKPVRVCKIQLGDPMVWHRRLGHCSLNTIKDMVKKNIITGVGDLKHAELGYCEACATAKQSRKAIPSVT